MNLRIAILSLLVLAGCGKTSDLAAMQDEANGIANTYRTRVEGFQTRFRSLATHLGRIQQDSIGAQELPTIRTLLTEASTRLNAMQNEVAQAPTKIRDAARDSTEQELKAAAAANQPARNPRAELIKVMVPMRTRLAAVATEINRDLDTIEGWIAYLELRPTPVVAAATPPPPPTTTPVEPVPGSDTGPQ